MNMQRHATAATSMIRALESFQKILCALFCSLISLVVFGQSNTPPAVRITYPMSGNDFTTFSFKIKAEASDLEGPVTEVRFFADGRLIGTATNAPFNILWRPDLSDSAPLILTTEATDNAGGISRSAPVNIFFSATVPPAPEVPIVSPKNGALFAIGEDVEFSAEVTSSALHESGPVEFIVDDISSAVENQPDGLNATNPPMSVLISNLTEGFHSFTVRYLGSNGAGCYCGIVTNIIQVIKLGIINPSVSNGRISFSILSAFPDKLTTIERSTNLTDWEAVGTLTPKTNRFLFSESFPLNSRAALYRARIQAP